MSGRDPHLQTCRSAQDTGSLTVGVSTTEVTFLGSHRSTTCASRAEIGGCRIFHSGNLFASLLYNRTFYFPRVNLNRSVLWNVGWIWLFLSFSLCSDMNSRAGFPAQVYKTASAETPRPSQLAQPSPFQLSASVPKSFFSKQPVRNKHPTGWKRTDEPPPRPLPFTDPKK